MPPNSDVMRRMNVDLPHPESAAKPMITGPSRFACVTTRALRAFGAVARFCAATGRARTAVANPSAEAIVFGEVLCVRD